MRITPVLVADANSTDGTPGIVRSFGDRLTVDVIPGGMPAVGRNRGAALAKTRYVLFLDADIELAETWLIRRCIEKMQQKELQLATTNICPLSRRYPSQERDSSLRLGMINFSSPKEPLSC